MDNSQEPAYPTKRFEDGEPYWTDGFTKMEAFTLAAMKGIISANSARIESGRGLDYAEAVGIAREAIIIARATLEELSKE